MLFYPLIPALFGLLGLALFTTWYSALVMVAIVGTVIYLAIRNHELHHAEQYDSRIDGTKALANYIEEVKKRSGKLE